MNVRGGFEVKMNQVAGYVGGAEGIKLGRMSLDKTFHGALEAKSKGEMLSAITPVHGSAGYVAIEQVHGKLEGKQGTFVLQHYGMMDQGQQRLILEVVPDSGTGELVGLSGQMEITIENKNHYYEFDYEL